MRLSLPNKGVPNLTIIRRMPSPRTRKTQMLIHHKKPALKCKHHVLGLLSGFARLPTYIE
ncbi:hypothetical protein HOLleu_13183 [Holothuria leucospilota]|uniref:Uncharacterized protein n=1 Tax=Holothuria leucospilota TaxID=206669 RepID=A0A9Q1CCJ8_HOLLE|nr:hypothetical protein HOLleu_13183 [Holothuria leucospilota]